MLNLTDIAKEKIRLILKERDSRHWGVRFRYFGGIHLDVTPVELKNVSPEDSLLKFKKKKLLIEVEDFKVVLDKNSEQELEGASVDFIDGGILQGVFEVTLKKDQPVAVEELDLSNPQVKKVKDLLDSEINPAIAMHGGYAELLNIKDNMVYLRMGGGCQGCGMVDVTLRQGIELRIKEQMPEILGVIDQTNHAGGANPYFQPSK